jgi:hypothetical protein
MFELSQEITALAKQEQGEPVATARFDGTLHWIEPYGVGLHRIQGFLYTTPQPQQEQGEPVAIKHQHEWFRTGEMKAGQMRCISCGTWGQEDMPQQRPSRSDMTWIGLTAEDIDLQAKKDDHAAYFALGALWAEAVLKEKNT